MFPLLVPSAGIEPTSSDSKSDVLSIERRGHNCASAGIRTQDLILKRDLLPCTNKVHGRAPSVVHGTGLSSASAGIRTQDLILKRDLLYQLSYQRLLFKYSFNINRNVVLPLLVLKYSSRLRASFSFRKAS